MSQILTASEAISLLSSGRLQVLGHKGWYDCRANGQVKTWKRSPHRFSIPVKVGLKEAFRLEFNDATGGCGMALRERPEDFDPRKRSL